MFYEYVSIYGNIKIIDIKKVGFALWKTNPSAVVHFSIKKEKETLIFRVLPATL